MEKQFNKEDIDREIKKFNSQRELYRNLGDEMEALINNILNEKKIPLHEIISRVKEEDSLNAKMVNQKKKLNEIEDLLGIRIIAYLKSEVEKIKKIIEEEFEILQIKDFSKINSSGYRGLNYSVRLDEKRKELLEYQCYKNIKFEIQVTTILDHAWAEIQHDRSYKIKGLPKKFQKKFELLASTLELIDEQFDSTCLEIDSSVKDIEEKTEGGNIRDINLDIVSLRGYLNKKFQEYLGKPINPFFGDKNSEAILALKDLKEMDIKNLEELDEIIPPWFNEHIKNQKSGYNYLTLIMDLLVIRFKEEYFKKGKLIKVPSIIFSEKEIEFLRGKGINYLALCERYNIETKIDD